MARIKGSAVRARLDYLAKHYGASGRQRIVDALDPDHRRAIEEGVLVSGWYPIELSDGLLNGAERLVGTGDGSTCRAIGLASAHKGLTGTYSVFATRLKAHEIAQKMERTTSLVWKSYYDEGAFRTRATGKAQLESELIDMQVQSPWLCHLLIGYITGHVEVLGGRDVLVEHTTCVARGDTRCVWEARWR